MMDPNLLTESILADALVRVVACVVETHEPDSERISVDGWTVLILAKPADAEFNLGGVVMRRRGFAVGMRMRTTNPSAADSWLARQTHAMNAVVCGIGPLAGWVLTAPSLAVDGDVRTLSWTVVRPLRVA